MNHNGPIIVIEDDKDDQEMLSSIFSDLNVNNEVIFFSDGLSAFDYLVDTDQHPFLILSDINMPKMNGFELKQKIEEKELLRLKCIPYLFFTTSADPKSVLDAYSRSIQGYFKKPTNHTELKQVVKNIIDYWKVCHAPVITT